MKSLLGVRKQISNEVVLTELGAEDLRDRIHKSRTNFIKSKLSDPDEPLSIVYRVYERNNTKGYRMLQHAIHSPCSATERRIQSIRNSTQTKIVTYRRINPSLSVHRIYTSSNNYIADYRRVELTRFRVGSHRLKVETGRWSRIPRDQRTCACSVGGIQDERHVIFDCDFTRAYRESYELGPTQELHEVLSSDDYLDYIREIMKIFV